ncbi:MAG: CBS domain-containing protein [Candidatus Bathyarchaeota archaeon]|jgi:CBS domain-containing protein|nr:CBS domain-containing protein [Candidatus Bathyarchaeota archaeon]MDH5747309.1 CBS domain-containing protein [Candidatus Bathyarchaeota archaeon]
MSDIGLRSRMLVKDVMSSPVITIDEDAPANHVAELMDKHGLGCIIVTSKEAKPLGIITERDLVRRVLAKNVKPDSLNAKEVMTTPLITIEPDKTISEAARRMSRLNIRRLGVVYKEQLVGVLSSKDVLGVMPELIEIIQEQALIEGENRAHEATTVESTPLAGYCDQCGAWSDALRETNGDFLCEDCRIELGSEE